ncbi:hypothetical protein L6164_025599 [Bauhinia variegata]|uniref:Uncharacterized protein n=3 Tax=Bauhinia variegata TaxID=167791 RepID=A0ACB9M2E9_BAUVA|nr:hypothetical protein L6164_025599 [Bauhinia variegata]
MASFLQFLPLFLSSLFLFCRISLAQNSPFLLPVTKDDSTSLYLTTLSYGTPLSPTSLVVDLNSHSIWVDCTFRDAPSGTMQIVPRRSIPCLAAKTHEMETSKDSVRGREYLIFPENREIPGEGKLVQDVVALQESTASKIQLLFACSPSLQLNGAKGMIGLGRARTSLASQIFSSFNTQRKFTLCLSSSSGAVLFGNPGAEISRSLTFTPLATSQSQEHPSSEYFINVKSIKINGKKLSLSSFLRSQDHGRAQLSSVVPYTTLESSTYATLEKAYAKAAMAMNMTRVASVSPFGLCFGSKGIENLKSGPHVPVIELVLQSEMVKWRINGRNSMVRVNGEVMCLGFLDGGLNPRDPIVVGAYQMEDVILQFDLETSMLGFSSSLLIRDSSCSDLNFSYMPKKSSA